MAVDQKDALTPATWERDHRQLQKWVVPYLGNKPIASIEAPDLLEAGSVEGKGVIDRKWADYLDCLRRNASDRQRTVGNDEERRLDETQV